MNGELIWKTNKNDKRYCFKSKQSQQRYNGHYAWQIVRKIFEKS